MTSINMKGLKESQSQYVMGMTQTTLLINFWEDFLSSYLDMNKDPMQLPVII